MTVIHWFRRDLRISDNTALLAAAEEAGAEGRVATVYVLSGWRERHHWAGPLRQEFLCGCLGSLQRNLEAIGGRLILRCGEATEELGRLVAETGARAIHTNADPDPHGKLVERRLEKMCAELGVALHCHHDHTLHGPDEVRTGPGGIYRVFTPYSRNWLSLDKRAPGGRPGALRSPGPEEAPGLPLPTLAHWGLALPAGASPVEAGERAARERLRAFLAGAAGRYGAERDIPHGRTTSRLSQDLRFGLLSVREIWAGVERTTLAAAAAGDAVAADSLRKYKAELAWREFYFQILHHFPDVLRQEFNPALRGLPWREADAPGWAEWCEGRTGFPIVDAGMRELAATGFMHNRVRMIVAMFLTKDLRIHWRLGESWFMRHLVDGEIASNNGGWQWSAGTGADAAPYFRIQNPWTQSGRFDAEARYIRRWVPELGRTPLERIHGPPPAGLSATPGYPRPIVDHARERDATLAMFKAHKE